MMPRGSWLPACVWTCALPGFLLWSAEETAPARQILPPVVVYYSKEDPRWSAAEKVIDTVAKQNPDLKLKKISFDDVQGYWQLLEAERTLSIHPTGDLTLTIGTIVLTSKDARRDIESYFAGVVKSLRSPDQGRGRLKTDRAAFARRIFGPSAAVDPAEKQDAGDRFYEVTTEGKRVGWVVDAFRAIACPVCIDLQCLIAVGAPDVRILAVEPQRGIERYGVPLDAEDTGLFVGQFKDRMPASPAVRTDAIVGATKTCRTYEIVVREVLKCVQQREQERKDRAP